jgi:hypothetical protein
MPCILLIIIIIILNMEISGGEVRFRTKHLPIDSGDLNTERRKTA